MLEGLIRKVFFITGRIVIFVYEFLERKFFVRIYFDMFDIYYFYHERMSKVRKCLNIQNF